MSVDFFNSRSGALSCSSGGINLHSAYDPVKEAQRFVNSLSFEFKPKAVIVTFPCISYCADFLRDKFSDAKLYAIQIDNSFNKWDYLWDKTFIVNPKLSDDLYNYLGDEVLISAMFISWNGAEKAFNSQYSEVWKALKNAVLKSRNILNTRSYFSKRWIKNSFRFATFLKNAVSAEKGNSDIVICASGPSLNTSIPFIKKYRERFYLICVSSALSPLTEHGIKPDMCVSTDGGYWAKLHLSFCLKKNPDITLSLSPEGNVFAWNFKNPVLPLSYGDGPSENILSEMNFPLFHAQRNGTVSGTAANIALTLTEGNIYFCGLDLSSSKGFAHTQPNELERNDSRFDNRFRTTETRITPSTFQSQSLEIYRQWFSHADFNKRLFRLSDSYNFSSALDNVPDVNWNYFEKHSSADKKKPLMKPVVLNDDKKNRSAKLIDILNRHSMTLEWMKEAFPVEFVLLERNRNTTEEKEMLDDITSKMNTFKNNISVRLRQK